MFNLFAAFFLADQKNKQVQAAFFANLQRAAEADRPRMIAKLKQLGYSDSDAQKANSWLANDLERRLPRIQALLNEMIVESQARASIFLSDTEYANELAKAKKRKKWLIETAARSGVPVDVIASSAVGINPVDAQGNVDWTEARKVEQNSQDAIAVYDYDIIEEKLANKGIYLIDLGIKSSRKTPEEARRVMSELKARNIVLDGPAELGNPAISSMIFDWFMQSDSQKHEKQMQEREIAEVKRQERLLDWSEIAGWFASTERNRVNPALLGAVTIQFGSVGPLVKVWQEFLMRQGYSLAPYGADSEFGSVTKAATIQFQRDQKLTMIDGIVGEETWTAKDRIESPTPPPAPPVPVAKPPGFVTTNRNNEVKTNAWLLPVALAGLSALVLLNKNPTKSKKKRRR